jgi:polar amino acid transport system substrate-binding protein
MTMIKTLTNILLLHLIVFSPALVFSENQIPVTIYSDENYAPYSYVEDGEAKGIYTEIVKKIFSQMKDYNVTIKAVKWKYGLHLIKTGQGLAIYPPYRFYVKRHYMRPYSLPIMDEKVVVVCRPEILKKTTPKFPEDYHQLTFGRNSGFQAGGKPFWSAIKKGKINLIEKPSTADNLIMLINKEIDCYLNDRYSILWEQKKLLKNEKYNIKQFNFIESTVVSKEKGYLGFTDNDKDHFSFKMDFVTKFNYALVKMKNSGELDKIIDTFLGKLQ